MIIPARITICAAAALIGAAAPSLAEAAGGTCVGAAAYAEPTARYDHGILGDAIEWGALRIEAADCGLAAAPAGPPRLLRLPETMVFEDVAPRIVDADGDGTTEVLVVETDLRRGARLAIYDAMGAPIAATPFIGRTHRWLAPVGQGVGDFDGDGRPEIAYVDRPHLDRVLRFWRLDGGALIEIAALEGVTNHRIGDTHITGGVRSCGSGDEAIVVSADWARIIAVTLRADGPSARDIGAYAGPASIDAALACNS